MTMMRLLEDIQNISANEEKSIFSSKIEEEIDLHEAKDDPVHETLKNHIRELGIKHVSDMSTTQGKENWASTTNHNYKFQHTTAGWGQDSKSVKDERRAKESAAAEAIKAGKHAHHITYHIGGDKEETKPVKAETKKHFDAATRAMINDHDMDAYHHHTKNGEAVVEKFMKSRTDKIKSHLESKGHKNVVVYPHPSHPSKRVIGVGTKA